MNSFAQRFANSIFWPLAAATRPYGGLRPHRIMHWLGKLAAGSVAPTAEQFRWCRDRYGSRMRLHPYYLIDRHVIAFGEYESDLQKFLSGHIKPGMVCLDVGANIGAVTLSLARLTGPHGRVIAFEPNPQVARRLSEHVEGNQLSNVKIEPCALAATAGTMTLAIASSAHENQGMSSLVEFNHGDLKYSVEVPVDTLDGYAARCALPKIDFIKVDIQGAEPQFLQGAKETISKFQPMIAIEIAASSLAEANTTAADLVGQLNDLGLEGFELRSHGQLGKVIDLTQLPADYSAENALFLQRPKAIGNNR